MLQEKTKKLFAILAKKVFTEADRDRVEEEITALGLEAINLIETNKDGNTALHLACMNNHETKVVELLLDLGATLDAQNRLGKTPTQFATCNGNQANLTSLISKNADLRMQDFSGNNALHLASTVTSVQGLAEKLTSDEIKENLGDGEFFNYINCQNNSSKTPLHIAAEFNNEPVLNVLLGRGANTQIQDENGHTALDLARKNPNNKTTSMLVAFDPRAISEEIFEELLERTWRELEFKQQSFDETEARPSSSPTPFTTEAMAESTAETKCEEIP